MSLIMLHVCFDVMYFMDNIVQKKEHLFVYGIDLGIGLKLKPKKMCLKLSVFKKFKGQLGMTLHCK